MLHARKDYNRIQDPALADPSLLSRGSTPIGEDEPVFLVRAKDVAFVETVVAWIAAHSRNVGCDAMVDVAAKHIAAAVAWQSKNATKNADAPPEALT